jgi:hypothetical protein
MAQQLSGDDRAFGGIVLDSACTGASVVSADEYFRYCRDTGPEYRIEPNSSGVVRFGDAKKGSKQGRVRSLGQARIRASIDSFGEVFEFCAHVVPGTDTPMLMSLQDLDGLGYEMRTGTRTLWAKDRNNPTVGQYPNGPHQLAPDDQGRCVIRWRYHATALFTDLELRKFHRSYGHASADKALSALREAGFDDLPADTKETLADIARRCEPCQRNQQKPRQFSVSLQWRGQRFNHVVLADVVNFADGDLVHILDAATKLNAARFTKANKNPSAAEIWSVIRECWINVYVGPPDILQFDQGTSMTSAFVQTACALNGIQFEAIPTEAPWRLGQVERAHEPLRVAYNKLKAKLPDLDRDALLILAVKSVNDAVGPAGVSPTMAVFALRRAIVPLCIANTPLFTLTGFERCKMRAKLSKSIRHRQVYVPLRNIVGQTPESRTLLSAIQS